MLWPLLLAATGFPLIVSAVVLPWYPESPRYLYVNRNDREGAKKGKKKKNQDQTKIRHTKSGAD